MTNSNTMGLLYFPVSENSQDEKIHKKQKITRNEFLRTSRSRFGIPLVKRQNIDLKSLEPWGYSKTKQDDAENAHKIIHFFTYDWNFETVYNKPDSALEKLSQYYAVMTPEFSTYKDMPLVLQMNSVFKNRWCGAFWQKHGLLVIPTITWGTPDSYAFCFEGVEEGNVVAVSTYAREDNERGFMDGYNSMLDAIKPSAILCYGEPFAAMKGNVIALSPYNHEELIAKMGMREYMNKYFAGDLYPSN